MLFNITKINYFPNLKQHPFLANNFYNKANNLKEFKLKLAFSRYLHATFFIYIIKDTIF